MILCCNSCCSAICPASAVDAASCSAELGPSASSGNSLMILLCSDPGTSEPDKHESVRGRVDRETCRNTEQNPQSNRCSFLRYSGHNYGAGVRPASVSSTGSQGTSLRPRLLPSPRSQPSLEQARASVPRCKRVSSNALLEGYIQFAARRRAATRPPPCSCGASSFDQEF